MEEHPETCILRNLTALGWYSVSMEGYPETERPGTTKLWEEVSSEVLQLSREVIPS